LSLFHTYKLEAIMILLELHIDDGMKEEIIGNSHWGWDEGRN